MDSKIALKVVQKLVKTMSISRPFFQGFGALQVPLESLLGPSDAVLDGLSPPPKLKNCMLLKVFANATFQ